MSRTSVGRFLAGTACLACVSALAWLVLLTVVPSAIGWRTVTLTSGSMSPAIRTGDVVVARPYHGTMLKTGSVVVYRDPAGGTLVTHRVVGRGDRNDYITKGDANVVVDSTPVPARNIVGVGRLVVPRVGLPALWLRTGDWAALSSLALVLGAALWYSRFAIDPRHDPWRVARPRTPATARPRRLRVLVPALVAISVIEVAVGSAAVVVTQSSRAAYVSPLSNGVNSFGAADYQQRYLRSAAPSEGGSTPPLLPFSALDTAPTPTSLPNYDPGRNDDPGETVAKGSGFQAWYVKSTGHPLVLSGPTQLRLWTAMARFDRVAAGSLTATLYDCDSFPVSPYVGCAVLGTATRTSAGSWSGGSAGWVEKTWNLGTIDHEVPDGKYLALVLTVSGDSGADMMLAYDTTAYRSALQVG